jgi:lipopolysaccharide/colanic/teichoic acid biosynthesis glycosyltransferase
MRLRYAMRAPVPGAGPSICEARENVLVVGLSATAELFLRCVAENADGRVMVAGLLGGAERHRRRLLGAYPVLGLADQLEKVLRDLDVHGVRIDRIVVAKRLDRLSVAAREALLRVKSARNIHVDVLAERIGSGEPPRPKPDGCGEAASAAAPRAAPLALDLEHLASRPYLRRKRLLDAAAAGVIAVALAPLMLFVGFVVILDGGYPPIFWQQRPGAYGRPIRVLKFRTMRAAYDQRGRQLADDERVSIVGRFLRRMHLDELPQVYNILIGQMSLVGPRPLLPADQSPGLPARLAIRPGLTGWAQVKGGRDLTVQDKAALDIWYIKHASFRLDLVILLSTLRTIIFGERVDRDAIRQAWRELSGPDTQLR